MPPLSPYKRKSSIWSLISAISRVLKLGKIGVWLDWLWTSVFKRWKVKGVILPCNGGYGKSSSNWREETWMQRVQRPSTYPHFHFPRFVVLGTLISADSDSDTLRSEPNSPDVLTLRGLVLFLSSKTAQALQHAQQALRLDPGHEPAQRLRKRVKDVERLKEEGNTAFKSGRLDEAMTKYTEAIEVSRLREKPRLGP